VIFWEVVAVMKFVTRNGCEYIFSRYPEGPTT
jgi:hypothetical protein